MKKRKHTFKSYHPDPRPVNHFDGVWFIVGQGYDKEIKKAYWMIVMFLSPGEDVFEYFPEAKDIELVQGGVPEIKRGGDLEVAPMMRSMRFEDYFKFVDGKYNPTFLFVLNKLAKEGVSRTEIAKRMGINGGKFKRMLESDPVVSSAYLGGYEEFLRLVANG